MHISISVFIIFGIWRYSNWKNWRKYQSTMLLAAMGNLLYNFLYYNKHLWVFKPDFPMSYNASSIIFSFVILPGSALWFLSKAPRKFNKILLHILKWTIIYVLVEWILILVKLGKHNYGWTMWWSLAWDIMMFTIWFIHHKRPLIAYFLSTIMVLLMLLFFPL